MATFGPGQQQECCNSMSQKRGELSSGFHDADALRRTGTERIEGPGVQAHVRRSGYRQCGLRDAAPCGLPRDPGSRARARPQGDDQTLLWAFLLCGRILGDSRWFSILFRHFLTSFPREGGRGRLGIRTLFRSFGGPYSALSTPTFVSNWMILNACFHHLSRSTKRYSWMRFFKN